MFFFFLILCCGVRHSLLVFACVSLATILFFVSLLLSLLVALARGIPSEIFLKIASNSEAGCPVFLARRSVVNEGDRVVCVGVKKGLTPPRLCEWNACIVRLFCARTARHSVHPRSAGLSTSFASCAFSPVVTTYPQFPGWGSLWSGTDFLFNNLSLLPICVCVYVECSFPINRRLFSPS
jgi:hypothetical protein